MKFFIVKAFLMSGKEFLKELKEGKGIGYAIMVKPKEDKSSSSTPIPVKVQELLDQFKDIICDGATTILPPNREKSHQINFIPRASLPKKSTYKMTP